MGKTLFQSAYALLTYLKNEKILLLEWKSACTEDEYKIVFKEALKIGNSNKVQFFLSDLRNEGPVSYSNLLWLRNNIVPKATELGIQKVGLIFDGELYVKIYADSIRASLEKSNISINYFNNEEEAKSWFKA